MKSHDLQGFSTIPGGFLAGFLVAINVVAPEFMDGILEYDPASFWVSPTNIYPKKTTQMEVDRPVPLRSSSHLLTTEALKFQEGVTDGKSRSDLQNWELSTWFP